jgi:hypothetical protein
VKKAVPFSPSAPVIAVKEEFETADERGCTQMGTMIGIIALLEANGASACICGFPCLPSAGNSA